MEKPIVKKYYTIGEVAKLYGLKTSALRFWEDYFDTLHPKKNKKGNRQFTTADIAKVAEIYVLVKKEGYMLWGAKRQMILNGIPEKPLHPAHPESTFYDYIEYRRAYQKWQTYFKKIQKALH